MPCALCRCIQSSYSSPLVSTGTGRSSASILLGTFNQSPPFFNGYHLILSSRLLSPLAHQALFPVHWQELTPSTPSSPPALVMVSCSAVLLEKKPSVPQGSHLCSPVPASKGQRQTTWPELDDKEAPYTDCVFSAESLCHPIDHRSMPVRPAIPRGEARLFSKINCDDEELSITYYVTRRF